MADKASLIETASVLSDGKSPASLYEVRRHYMPMLRSGILTRPQIARLVMRGEGKIARQTRRELKKTMTDFRFSDHSEVIAALAVAEHTDNETLISARENFILAAKLAHGDEFNDVETLYRSGSPVTFTRPQQIIDRFMGAFESFHSREQVSPWAKLSTLFRR